MCVTDNGLCVTPGNEIYGIDRRVKFITCYQTYDKCISMRIKPYCNMKKKLRTNCHPIVLWFSYATIILMQIFFLFSHLTFCIHFTSDRLCMCDLWLLTSSNIYFPSYIFCFCFLLVGKNEVFKRKKEKPNEEWERKNRKLYIVIKCERKSNIKMNARIISHI